MLTAENSTESKCVHQVFEARAQHTPDALAVTCEGRSLSYGELNTRSNQLARYLQTLGVGPEVPVGIYVQRSLDTIVGLLGILKAGGAYVPLDPTYPPERIAFMLEDSRIDVFLTQEQLVNRLPQHRAQMVRLDADWKEIACCSMEDPDSGVTASNLAYVIYTSGSTGTPKGVAVNHSSVVHLFEVTGPLFAFTGSDVWTVSHSYAFDFSVWEIFGALLSGGRLVIVPLLVTQSPQEFQELLRVEGVTILSLTPPALRQLIQTERATNNLRVRLVIGGGDAFPSDLAPELLQWNVPVWNFYGPTESTVWSTIKSVVAADVEYNTIPVGTPLTDIAAYLLNDNLQPVPAGTAGELHLGGAGLARGYSRRPELTAERFIPDPLSDQPGARLYKTGDLGRRLANNEIEHLGRMDHQVKVRGFRIELEEIEAVLALHPSVQQAIVVVREDPPAEKRLVAYVVPRQGQTPKIGELLDAARTKLPEYMVPAAFVTMEKLPLTPNKKVDRLSLPAPEPTRPDLNQEFLAPRTPTEDMLAEIWASVLYLDRVGVHDNFFELGGHSLLATKVISRVRDTFQVDLPLSEIFEYPSVAQLAEVIEKASRSVKTLSNVSIRRAPRDGQLPLSFPQERVWFIQQLFPETLAYNFQSRLRFRGSLHAGVVEKSLTEIVRRHEIFRTTFPAIDGRPMQQIHEPWPVKLEIINLESLSESERSDAVEHHIRAELRKHFDLTKLPLIRWILLRLSEDDHVLLHVEHHLVHDGWSFNVFLTEFLELYRAFSADKPSPLPELPVQFADFAVWQRQWMQGDVARGQLDYWRETLAGSPQVLALPTDHPRPAVQSFRGTSRRLELPLDLCESLRKFSREHGVTLFMTLLAAFEVLLHRLTGQDDFRVGSGIANRRWAETESMIGMLVNTIALRADLSGDPDFLELLSRVRRSTLEAYTHQDLPFEMLVDALERDRDLSRNPLFQVMFNFHDAPLPQLDLPGITIDLVEVISNQSAKFDFNLIIIPRSEQRVGWSSRTEPAGITEIWEYNTDLFDEGAIERLANNFEVLLEGIVAQPDCRIARLPLLTVSERERIVVEWNETKRDYPQGECVHELFELQVEKTPAATAVVCGGERVSYRELNERANQLAHYLQNLGVEPEQRIALCLPRTIGLLVAVLGTLKAGGAYVPLDPGYPRERVALMLRDAGAAVLLTEKGLLGVLPESETKVVCLDSEWEKIAQEDVSNPDHSAAAENLAYVIYTSGSTGEPKGVAIEHRSTVTFLRWANETFSAGELRGVLASTSLCFDLSIFELFAPLSCGGKVILVENALHLPAVQEEVTLVNTVPSAMTELVKTDNLPATVRTVNLAGEALRKDLVQEIYKGETVKRVFNLYGPSEDTTYSTFARIEKDEMAEPTIGRPVANTMVYLLDGQLEPVPVGVPGELYLSGGGIARGYLERAGTTAERFLPNPFSEEPGVRMYWTGDMARYREDGSIEFLGRVDHQVKLRGFRIELGEIETALLQHPRLREAVVVAKPDQNDALVAYVVGDFEEGTKKLASELRDFLKEKLPGYMIPTVFVPLPALPFTPNGKLDRKALPDAAGLHSEPEQVFAPPQTEVERIIAEVWQELLGVDRIGVRNNFFDLGGNSLLMLEVCCKLQNALNRDVSVIDLFQHPTVSSLATHLVLKDNVSPDGQKDNSGVDSMRRQGQFERRQRARVRRRPARDG